MTQEFQTNVEKLFYEMVPVGDARTYDIDKLVTILRRRATRPIRVDTFEDSVRLTYYNVTIVLARDLASMRVVYNSDYQVNLGHIACADPYRLADFIAALERDIPQWKHIWMAHDQLIREKMRMEQKVKNVMRNLRQQWTKACCPLTEKEREESRLHFYNLRAHQLMLKHNIPFWRNRKTEAEIIEQCLVYHITPPIERWYEEWTTFTEELNTIIEERQRKREEKERAAQKMQHLVHLKKQKMKAVLGTIELHPSVRIEVTERFNIYPGATDPLSTGHFCAEISFGETNVGFYSKYSQLDSALPTLLDSLRRLNDLWPELEEALAVDRSNIGNLYIRSYDPRRIGVGSFDTLFLVAGQNVSKDIVANIDLYSTPILYSMNRIIRELRQYLQDFRLKKLDEILTDDIKI